MPVDYDLTGDSTPLVTSVTAAAAAMGAAEAQADKTTEAVGDLDKATAKAGKTAKTARTDWKEFGDGLKGAGELMKTGLEGVGKLAGAFVGLVREVAAAKDELSGLISPADQQRVEDLAQGLEEADKASLLLKTSFATSLGPEIDRVIDAFVGAADKAGQFLDWLEKIRESKVVTTLQQVSAAARAVLTLGLSEVLEESFETLEEGGEDARAAMRLLLEAEQAYNDAVKEGERLAEQWGKEAEESKKKAAEAAKEAASVEAKAAEEERKRQEDLQKDLAKLREEGLQRRLDAIETEALASAEFAQQVLAQMEKETEAFQEKLNEQQALEDEKLKERKEAQKEAATQIADAWVGLFGELAAMNQQAKEEDLASNRERQEALRERLKEAEGAERDRLRERLAQLQAEEEATKKAARKAFALSQAAAVGEVGISAATAFMGLLASLSGLGFGAPIAAGAIVGPAVATQLAAIGKQKAPAHSGAVMGADEFFVGGQMVRQGERGVIFNQRAVESGAVERAMAENRNGPTNSGPAVLVLTDGGRAIASAIARDARRPDSPLASVFGSAGSGVVDPWRRR